MGYIHYIPCDSLKPYVKSFAISVNENAGSYKILPGTSVVMGFQYAGALSFTDKDITTPLSNAGVTGLLDTYRIFSNKPNTGTVLVTFTETGAASILKVPVHELYGKSLSLDDLLLSSQMDVVVLQLNEAKTNEERINVVERFLIARVQAVVKDELVNAAVNIIKQHAGTLKVTALAEKLYISQSRLEKRFRAVVGASPKKFSSIVRLNHLANTSPQKNKLTSLGLDAGYYDQAHFIKDFKSFTGQTPEEFFSGK